MGSTIDSAPTDAERPGTSAPIYAEIDGVDVVRKLRDHAAEVARTERNPEALDDLTAGAAEVYRETEKVRAPSILIDHSNFSIGATDNDEKQ